VIEVMDVVVGDVVQEEAGTVVLLHENTEDSLALLVKSLLTG
jgi:quercetin dioxygenase-like cupin family protein